MNKIACIFIIFTITAQEHIEQPHPEYPEVHITIEVPERPDNPEPRTPQDIKRLKIKVAAVTALVTTLITGGIALYLGIHNCK